ncbi:hypothetical protein KY362_07015 [Candidatus Woesearchaeota archaeon]|nr:hypothetical protein [Candidatus Woesearchaeota archaeon]
MKVAVRLIPAFILLILLAPSVLSWARHDQMTAEVVRDLGWLDAFEDLTVTEYIYDDPTISDVVIRYEGGDYPELTKDDFYYHSLYEPVLFFDGAPLAGKINAKQILIDFSNEPDWEIDQGLQLSWMQAFHGESQGYRHIYYPTGSFHIPMGFVGQGATPERVQHFYDMSKMAFERGDIYWGFRFLARAMHYVQDMSQPYHTRQLYWRWINLKEPYYGTLQTIKNYHFTYESYQANLFRLEQQGAVPPVLVSALRYSLPVEAKNPEELAKYIARRSYWRSSRTMSSSIDFLGEKYLSNRAAAMTEEEFFENIQRHDKDSQVFHEDLESRMVLFGKATKSFLEYARRDLNLDQYALE